MNLLSGSHARDCFLFTNLTDRTPSVIDLDIEMGGMMILSWKMSRKTRRRLVELVLFLVTGMYSAIVVNYINNSNNTVEGLVKTDSLIMVYTHDTTKIFDLDINQVGTLYSAAGIFLHRKSYPIDSGFSRVKIIGWIWYENIFDIGKEWLVLKDENIRICNNCAKIGRIRKNVKMQKIYSPKYREWNLVSVDAFVPTRSLRPNTDTRYFSCWGRIRSGANTPYLTKNGSYNYRFRDNPKWVFSDFIVFFPFILLVFFIFFYFRHMKKPEPVERWVLRIIDLTGFVLGAGGVLILRII